jgi:UTP-glucose-1-phosphate uridylyltransferase
MNPIRKAILPVAGLGTRFLPATKAMPKEMLPVVDRPLIQHVVDEARQAGIEHFIFVTGRNKAVIEDHFDRQFELELTLTERRRKADLEDQANSAVANLRRKLVRRLAHGGSTFSGVGASGKHGAVHSNIRDEPITHELSSRA